MWELDHNEGWRAEELMLSNCDAGEDSWESLGQQGDKTSQSYRKLILNIHWKNWCWSWSSYTFTTWCEEPAHWKNPNAGKDWGHEEKRTSEDEMVGRHHWLNGWVWANFRIQWRTGKHGVLQLMGSQRAGYDLATERQVIGNKITSNPPLSSMSTMEVY